MARTEMRMIRWIISISLREKRTNQNIKEEVVIVGIEAKSREARLRWYDHIKRRGEYEPLRRALEMEIEGKRRRGRPRKRWMDCIHEDMNHLGMVEEWTQDRPRWRCAAGGEGGNPN